MAMKIFELVGSIMVDNDKANQSIQKTDEKAQGVGKTLLKGIGTAAKWGAGLVAGASAAVVGVTKLAESTSDAADHIDKMSQKIGISAASYQEWDYILSQNGMDVDNLKTGMKTLTKQMDSANAGSKASAEAFKQLGVSVTNADGSLRSQEEVFNESITALQNMENQTQRAAIASQLFGKSGVELAPLLNQSAKSTDELRKKAHDLGLVMSDETIKSGVSMTDTMDTMKRSFAAVKNSLGSALMPIIEKFAKFIISSMPKIQSLFQKLSPIVTTLLDKLLPPMITLAEKIFPILINLITALLPPLISIIEQILPILIGLIQQVLPFVVQVVEMILPLLVELINTLLPILSSVLSLLGPLLDLTVALLDPLLRILNLILPPLIALIDLVVGKIVAFVRPAIEGIAKLLNATLVPAMKLVTKALTPVKDAFVNVFNKIKEVWSGLGGFFEKIWDGISQTCKTVMDALIGLIKAPINAIIDMINGFIGGLNKIKIPSWVPGVGGKGISIPKIPKLEKGGLLEKGQLGFLEGSGAEAVVPLEKNKKWIAKVAADMDTVLGGSQNNDKLDSIIVLMKEIINSGFYLDGNTLVGGIASRMDNALGRIAVQKARG